MTRQFNNGDRLVSGRGKGEWVRSTNILGNPVWVHESGSHPLSNLSDDDVEGFLADHTLIPARKFKVGDKVEYAGGVIMAAQPGATATVTGYQRSFYNPDGDYLQVKWDRNDLWNSQMDGAYDETLFKPYVKPVVTFKDGDIYMDHIARYRKGGKWFYLILGMPSLNDDFFADCVKSGFGHIVDLTAKREPTRTTPVTPEAVFEDGDVIMFNDASDPLVRSRGEWRGWTHLRDHLVQDLQVEGYLRSGEGVLHRKDFASLTLKPVPTPAPQKSQITFADGDVVQALLGLTVRRAGRWYWLLHDDAPMTIDDTEMARRIEDNFYHLVDLNAREAR